MTGLVDGDHVASKVFKEAPAYDTLSLSLTKGTTLFRLKATPPLVAGLPQLPGAKGRRPWR